MARNLPACFLLALCAVFVPARAYPVFESGYPSGIGPIASGMADAALGYEKHADGFFLNPSMPAGIMKTGFCAGYGVNEDNLGRSTYLSAVYPINAFSALSAGYSRTYYPGPSAINENIYIISPAYRISGAFTAGMNFKYYSTDSMIPSGSSSGIGIDLGMTAKLRDQASGSGFNLSLVLYDIHSSLTWESGLRDPVGSRAAAGIDYYASRDMLLSVSFLTYSGKKNTYVMTGAEKWFKDGLFALRAGYKKKFDGPARYHAGASAAGPGVRFDYSISADAAGNGLQHKIGFSLAI